MPVSSWLVCTSSASARLAFLLNSLDWLRRARRSCAGWCRSRKSRSGPARRSPWPCRHMGSSRPISSLHYRLFRREAVEVAFAAEPRERRRCCSPSMACAEFHDVGFGAAALPIVMADLWRCRRRRSSSSCCRSPSTRCHRDCEPVRMSCWFGVSPRPLSTSPFSVSEFSFDSLLLSLCRSATLAATCTPLALNHGPAADAVLRVHAGLAVRAGRARVRAPLAVAGARRLRQRRAVRIRARQPAKVRALARVRAGDEEAQGVALRVHR